jgi:UDP-N-acetylmuramate dehydrogenase
MHARADVSLAPRTTLGLGGRAARLVEASSEAEIVEAVIDADARGEPLFVLGGGSNVVIGDDGFPGVVVRVASRGVRIERASGDDARVLVDVEAGEEWDALVARCVNEGLAGMECMSGIPGLVGATPMQNVGAYGQEVSDTIVSVRAFDRHARALVELDAAACGFHYRDSMFKRTDRYVVVGVRFALRDDGGVALPVRYAELARALGDGGEGRGGGGGGEEQRARASVLAVRSTVLALRRAKGMVVDAADPDSVSAGSFFVNPVVTADALAAIEARAKSAGVLAGGETMPRFTMSDARWKLSAGWLIERAGFAKGFTSGHVGVSRKHALALVHRGGGTTGELLELARAIRDAVHARFGVTLAPEPVLVGCVL